MTKKKYTPGPTITGDFDRVGLVNALTNAKVKLAKINILINKMSRDHDSGLEFCDNECPFCKKYQVKIEELSK